jgi:exopolysaccharide production protein ExoY
MSGATGGAHRLAASNQNSTVLLIDHQIISDCSFTPTNGSKIVSNSFDLPHDHTNRHMVDLPLGRTLKRSIDILVSAAGLLLLAPIMVLVALLIYLSMGRPILFAHERIGFRGKSFKCYKFRTMVNGAAEKLAAYLHGNPHAAEEWQIYHKLKEDPRITSLGLLLRKASLDELPQLLNVLRGDMSCVGPRPVPRDELRRYKSSARHYMRVQPGVTGLWQISGRSRTTYAYRVALDRAYVCNWSFWLDVKIIIKTVPAVFRFHEGG